MAQVLRGLPATARTDILVGIDTGDDAAIVRLDEHSALVQTLDFFTPIIDDPYMYGAIAAANALSDVYAMGGRPLTAMNILCYPIEDRPGEELSAILRGGSDKIREAGAVLVGGHSITDAEPKYGLSVTGMVALDQITTNQGAQPGDKILLTKPIGTGIITTAQKFDDGDPPAFEEACRSMMHLNVSGAKAVQAVGVGPTGVHAVTDVTGFSLLGHLNNIARESQVNIRIESVNVPIFPGVRALVERGNTTQGGKNNAEFLADMLTFADSVDEVMRSILLDPQTSGGLAIVVHPDAVDALRAALQEQGALTWNVIGDVVEGVAGLVVY